MVMPSTPALEVLQNVFGYDTFRGDQAAIITHVIDGGDAVVLMPTGGGKSLCYQIPALVRPGTGLVISPLIALMHDQVAALNQLGVRAASVHSGMGREEQQHVEHAYLAGELDLLYVAPERFNQPAFRDLLTRGQLSVIAVDEAHCVAQWGHDFRPDYLRLGEAKQLWPEVPRLALTATATPATHEELTERLQLHGAEHFVASFDRPNISYHIAPKRQVKQQLTAFVRERHRDESGIVYALSRKRTEEIAQTLQEAGVHALAYHAGLTAAERARVQQRFVTEDGVVVVATIAFGMGIDKPDVRFVAHIDLPKSLEGYYQETGRAGRDGLPAEAWMSYGLQDVIQQRQFIESGAGDAQIKASQSRHLDHMLALCELVTCRRAYLLEYFGETRVPENCGNCDVCLSPPETWDATVPAQMLLSTVLRTWQERGRTFGAGQHIDVLRGVTSERVTQLRLDELSTWGIGTAWSATQWRAVVRHLIAAGLCQAQGKWGVLWPQEAAKPVLNGAKTVLMNAEVMERSTQSTRSGTRVASNSAHTLSSTQQQLFERLRTWRAATATTQGVPAYVVFTDATLTALAAEQPGTREDLLNIPGIGLKKLERYGDTVLQLLEEHDAQIH